MERWEDGRMGAGMMRTGMTRTRMTSNEHWENEIYDNLKYYFSTFKIKKTGIFLPKISVLKKLPEIDH
jgi:hypothetical protein